MCIAKSKAQPEAAHLVALGEGKQLHAALGSTRQGQRGAGCARLVKHLQCSAGRQTDTPVVLWGAGVTMASSMSHACMY